MNVRSCLLRQDRAFAGWRRLWLALQDSSCSADTWHFKRELAVLSPDEGNPRSWESTLLPFCVCMTSAQWGSTFRVYLGSGSKFWASGIKQLALVLLGSPPNQEP